MGKEKQKDDIDLWTIDDTDVSSKEYEKYRNTLTEEDIAIGDAIFKDVLD